MGPHDSLERAFSTKINKDVTMALHYLRFHSGLSKSLLYQQSSHGLSAEYSRPQKPSRLELKPSSGPDFFHHPPVQNPAKLDSDLAKHTSVTLRNFCPMGHIAPRHTSSKVQTPIIQRQLTFKDLSSTKKILIRYLAITKIREKIRKNVRSSPTILLHEETYQHTAHYKEQV